MSIPQFELLSLSEEVLIELAENNPADVSDKVWREVTKYLKTVRQYNGFTPPETKTQEKKANPRFSKKELYRDVHHYGIYSEDGFYIMSDKQDNASSEVQSEAVKPSIPKFTPGDLYDKMLAPLSNPFEWRNKSGQLMEIFKQHSEMLERYREEGVDPELLAFFKEGVEIGAELHAEYSKRKYRRNIF